MGNIYDGVFRTILNDCRKLVIPIINEIFGETFPNTAVLYLRTYKKTPDQMRDEIVTPGGTVEYDIPIMKAQDYTLDVFLTNICGC